MGGVADGTDAMTNGEATFWPRMPRNPMHEKRVPMAFRFLLVDVQGRSRLRVHKNGLEEPQRQLLPPPVRLDRDDGASWGTRRHVNGSAHDRGTRHAAFQQGTVSVEYETRCDRERDCRVIV